MNLVWLINQDDTKIVKTFVNLHANNHFVKKRSERNLAERNSAVDRKEFWKQMVGMRMTSVQRSGPNSPVARFLRTTKFPLTYERVACETSEIGRRSLIAETLRAHGGIRYYNRIANDLSANFDKLNAEQGWDVTLKKVNSLAPLSEASEERKVARFLQGLLRGFGPKQSRNLLQSLGLTRYEIPIDSRITRWLNSNGFPVTLTSQALSDPGYYEFVLDGIQALCSASDVFPCILDAAIFASFDGDAWTSNNTT